MQATHLVLETRLHSPIIDDWLPNLAQGESQKHTQGNAASELQTTRYSKDGKHYTECRLAGMNHAIDMLNHIYIPVH
ncbi:hypothetical protein [Isoalcanivorax indicus]|uniref:hypothetical protein n=1 Tax=Isoalcanivorax indicus TaxID=2202653 RepID=UPI000DB9C386|nr:hypothetical protein [Isoalcanivorax indicus]